VGVFLLPLPLLGLLAASALFGGRRAEAAGAELVRRALSAVNAPIAYGMGQGGKHPGDKLPSRTGLCDCSGFIAWVCGLVRGPRSTPPAWIETSNIVRDATMTRRTFRQVSKPRPGCFVVFPDRPGQQGHIGLITSLAPFRGVDCSNGVSKRTGRAISERDFRFFLKQPGVIFCELLPRGNT